TQDANTPFAVAFDASDHLVVTESGSNDVATFTVRRNGTLGLVDRVATGQAATCWVAATGNKLYASNAGSATESGYVDNDGTLTSAGATGADGGTVDASGSSDGRFLYVETGAAGVLDEFRVHGDGSLTRLGSVTVPDAVGAEGIAAS